MIKEKKRKFVLLVPTIGIFFLILAVLNLYSVFVYYERQFTIEIFDKAVIKLFTQPFSNLRVDIVSFWIILIGVILGSVWLVKIQQLHKRNMQEDSNGSAKWGEKSDLQKLRDREKEHNLYLLKDYWISKDMIKSKLTRMVLLIGGPGRGKGRGFFKPNIMNATGSMVIGDPKGEMLRDCGGHLRKKGYRIRTINVDEMWKSNKYNPLYYIRKLPEEAYELSKDKEAYGLALDFETLKDDDVLSLINNIFKSTDGKVQKTGDPFWEKAEMLLDQAVFFYTLYRLPVNERNFTSIMELLREGIPDEDGNSKLRVRFEQWRVEEPNHVGVKQWDHFQTAKGQMQNTIFTTAVARLASFNIQQLGDLTSDDEMLLDDLGAPGERGKVAIFVVTKPANDTFRYLTNIFWTQLFQSLDTNANKYDGYLPTPVDIYLDEWKQQGEIPLYLEQLAYLRGLNVGIVTGLQSINQVKDLYKEEWETIIDCVDSILFMGGNSKSTSEWISETLADQTTYKRSSGGSGSGKGSSLSYNWDVIGRRLATADEVRRMKQGYGILIMTGQKPFYGKIYDLKKHPNYKNIYEPRNPIATARNKYEHHKHLKEDAKKDKQVKALAEMGITGEVIENGLLPFDVEELSKFKIMDERDFITDKKNVSEFEVPFDISDL